MRGGAHEAVGGDLRDGRRARSRAGCMRVHQVVGGGPHEGACVKLAWLTQLHGAGTAWGAPNGSFLASDLPPHDGYVGHLGVELEPLLCGRDGAED